MKQTEGLANAKKPRPPNPKPSPKDFVWPSQKDHDDKVAEKIGASLQELLPAKGWNQMDLARAMYGTVGENEAPRNAQACRRWLVADHPIPNETAAGYIAELLGVSMARLLEPEGKFQAFPPMIRGRSDSKRFPFVGTPKTRADKKKKAADKTPTGRDREKQRAYNAKYRAKMKAARKGEPSYYMRKKLEKLNAKHKRAKPNGNGASEDDGVWVLADGVPVPEFQFASSEGHPGYLKITVDAVVPLKRAMAILHMLETKPSES